MRPPSVSPEDIRSLISDKYAGDVSVDITEDLKRLSACEPLAYVIGWVPFLGLKIYLDSLPLIPRPETEWWTELLCTHLKEKFEDAPFTLLDLCAGSGAIGLAVLKHLSNAHVTFSELVPAHADLIQKNIKQNALDFNRDALLETRRDDAPRDTRRGTTIVTGDLFTEIPKENRYDIIVTNPPYIPSTRVLEDGVIQHEPSEALFSGVEGLDTIERIAIDVPERLHSSGELWMECDISNIERARDLVRAGGAQTTEIHNDLYGRPRLLMAYYP
jgi:release factor glutamine methyltransferase